MNAYIQFLGSENITIILVIAVLAFFVFRWALKSLIKNRKSRNWVSIIAAIVSAPFLYFGLILAFIGILSYEAQYDFNQDRWFKDKETRFKMRDDIVESEILKGKHKSEIIAFIGKPDFGNSTDIWTYDLGTSNAGFGWQFNSLELSFKDERVETAKKIEIID